MDAREREAFLRLVRIAHCCRDWPVNPLSRMGRCGDCGQVPTMTDKTVEQYMAERAEASAE